jgi:hypothetical protein
MTTGSITLNALPELAMTEIIQETSKGGGVIFQPTSLSG